MRGRNVGRGHVKAHQRGMILASALIGVAAVVLAIVAGWSTSQSRDAANRLLADQRAYVEVVRTRVTDWYGRHLADLDGSAVPVPIAAVLDGSGVERRYNLAGAVSDLILRDGLGYRVIALWLPDGSSAPAFDFTAGVLSGEPAVSALINGRELESAAVRDTQARMRAIATRLETRFSLRQQVVSAGRADINQFRAAECAAVAAGEIACLDTYTPLAATALGPLAGLDASLALSAWGTPIYVSNLMDSQVSAPPYSMAVAAGAPWGAAYRVMAVQPL